MSQKRRAAFWMCAAGIVVVCAAVALRLKPVPPSLILEPVWTDVVKKGSMQLEVLGRGTLVRDRRFGDLVVRMVFPEKDAQGVRSGQHADIYIANTITAGCVGDRILLADMSAWDHLDQISLR